MWLTFVGDLACPVGVAPNLEGVSGRHFRTTIVNLEGALPHNPEDRCRSEWPGDRKLYNGPGVQHVLSQLNVDVASLANNHIADCSVPIGVTRARLEELGVAACGAGSDIEEAREPAVLHRYGEKLVFLSFGWASIECDPATKTQEGVNPLEAAHVLACVEEMRDQDRDATLVLLMHWNYELEPFPQPLHRRLAFRAIEKGADAVVGHHPHVVGGAEKYRDAPIVYSLGNWFMPQGRWFGSRIDWPEMVNRQLAFEWNVRSHECRFHWYEYQEENHAIVDRGVEPWNGERISALSGFRELSQAEYVDWFRENRHQRSALPVFVDPRHTVRNSIKAGWIRVRSCGVKLREFVREAWRMRPGASRSLGMGDNRDT